MGCCHSPREECRGRGTVCRGGYCVRGGVVWEGLSCFRGGVVGVGLSGFRWVSDFIVVVRLSLTEERHCWIASEELGLGE